MHKENTVENILLEKQFVEINVIDIEQKTVQMRLGNNEESEVYKEMDYEKGSREIAKLFLAKAERSGFLKKISIPYIEYRLKKSKEYSFNTEAADSGGEKKIYRYRFFYLDESKEKIIMTIEDITGIMNHDVLTGQFNRTGFLRYVTGILEDATDQTQYAILFFNIKGFKAINDLFGVEGGDRVLKESVTLLKESMLEPIAIARFEADHFVALVSKKNLDYDEITRICQRRLKINGKSFTFYSRCGIYMVTNVHHDVSGMCDRAKMAKEYIKDDHAKPYAVYNQTMREVFVKKKQLTSELEHALRNSEFTVFYQPIINVKTGQVASAEALVRWKHSEMGIISPAEFIETFEENGYISELDLFVEKTVKKLILNRYEKKEINVPIAINLSRMDFYDSDMMERILEDVKDFPKKQNLIRMEITESAYAAIMESGNQYIKSLKEAGVKILLDDFGSGYSSFSTLRDFDFDIIKIDMGFVQQIGKSSKVESIIKAIIEMAHHLHMQVIAEGAETEEQVAFLAKAKCNYVQGYYYSRPLPEQEFIAYLEDKNQQEKTLGNTGKYGIEAS